MNIKLQHLRFFVAVYEECSITSAARKLNATQSGVSVQVRHLEEELGIALFERVSTGVRPTAAGDDIYRRAARILLEVGGLEEDVGARAKSLTGEVRAGIMPTFARAILAPVITRFAQKNAFVEVKVTEAFSPVLTKMVAAGELDFAIVPGGDIPQGLRATFLDSDLELLVRHQPLPSAIGRVDLSKVDPQKLVLPSRSNARRAKIDRYLRTCPGSVHSILEMDSMMTTLDLVRRGQWASILPGCLCLPDLENPDLNLYPFENPAMTVDYLLIEPATTAAPNLVGLFADELAKEIRQACEICRNHFGA